MVLADLADHDAVRGLVPAASAFGPLTLLVNSAAEFEPDEIASLERARFERTMAVNLTAPLFLTQAFAAQAPAGADASIVNIVDQRVLKPTPLFFSYTLSKSALHAATTTLAQALAPKLRVNAVAPGPTLPSPRQTDAEFAAQAAACRSSTGRRPRISPPRCSIWRSRKRHRRHHRGRWRPASGLAHPRQRCRGIV